MFPGDILDIPASKDSPRPYRHLAVSWVADDRLVLELKFHPPYTNIAVSVSSDMGGAYAPTPVAEGVSGMLKVIGGLKADDSGKFYNYVGQITPW